MLRNDAQRSMIIIFILITIFSLCQNINFFGINIELPVLVNILPEGWRLPSTTNLISNTAIISMPVIFFMRHLTKAYIYEGIAIIVVLTISTVALVFLGFTWNKTILIDNTYYSIYFLFFTFLVYVSDYSGTLLFLPYLHRYESIMMRAYLLGDAISSGILAVLGFIQVSEEPQCISVMVDNRTKIIEQDSPLTFSVRIYFFILSFIMFSSLISFIILFILKPSQTRKDENIQLLNNDNQNKEEANQNKPIHNQDFWFSQHGLYLLAMFWTCFITYGFLPGLQTYVLEPYSMVIYQKTIVSAEIVYILVQILCAIFSNITVLSYPRLVHILNVIATILLVYVFTVAKMSPCPPFINSGFIGAVISSSTYLIINGINHLVFILLNMHFHQVSGKNGLFWSCVMIQCGTFSGALINYILTVYFNLFVEKLPCVNYSCSN